MQDLTLKIGKNLNEIRKKRGLSLDAVSELTGVSKAMLGQIERGESNPTIATLWKVSTGLKVSFSTFLDDRLLSDENLYLPMEQQDFILVEKGLMKISPLFVFDAVKGFEMFVIELESGCEHVSEPHHDGVEEHIVVIEGEMELILESTVYQLKKGDALRYHANKGHIYRNPFASRAVFHNLIHYMKG